MQNNRFSFRYYWFKLFWLLLFASHLVHNCSYY